MMWRLHRHRVDAEIVVAISGACAAGFGSLWSGVRVLLVGAEVVVDSQIVAVELDAGTRIDSDTPMVIRPDLLNLYVPGESDRVPNRLVG